MYWYKSYKKNGIIDVNNTTGRFRGKTYVIVGCK